MNPSVRSLFAGCCVMLYAAIVGAAPNAASAEEPPRTWNAMPGRPYLVRGGERRMLDSLQRMVDAEEWDEALDVALGLLDAESDAVVVLDDDHYVSLGEFVHRAIARMLPAALTRYRGLVDPTAEAWYRDGIEGRDVGQLRRVIDQSFCSSWGDDALLALGEIALELGDYQMARHCWTQLHPTLAAGGLAYPDTDASVADIRARLALVSIREANWSRAERELQQLQATHPNAQGRFGGREVTYTKHLASLLQQAQQWPPTAQDSNWPTFAGNFARTAARNATNPTNYEQQWSQPLDLTANNTSPKTFPIVVRDHIVYQRDGALHAVALATGQQSFVSRSVVGTTADSPQKRRSTLTSAGHRVFGTTSSPARPRRSDRSAATTHGMWGVDLSRDGAVDFRLEPNEASVDYVGAPVAEGSLLLVAMRSGGRTTRAGIACYDLGTGQLRWRRWLCQANSPGTGLAEERSHNLLTLDAGIVYTCPNLGIIAALRADDGKLLWLRSYQRFAAPAENGGDFPYYRGPNPAIYGNGGLFVLPTDGRELLALDAATGSVRWRRAVRDSASVLVGLAGDRLVLFDRKLQLLDANTGDLLASSDQWPLVGAPAIVGATIFWPTNEAIYAIDLTTAKPIASPLPLPESGGANLAIAGGYLVAAGPTQLTLFREIPATDQVSQLP